MKVLLAVVLLALTAFAAIGIFLLIPWWPEYHIHADFLVYLDGQPYNFSQEKYTSGEDSPLSNSVHLHDLEGRIIHVHSKGVLLKDFFNSLGMGFNSTCLTLDTGQQFCNSGNQTLKFYVNGQPSQEFGNYEIRDLDRILISFGSESPEQLASQISSVPADACVQSGKCPERGHPSNESSCTSEGCKL